MRMSRIASSARFAVGWSLAVVLASACGGQSMSSRGDDGGSAAGGSASGGSTSGGSAHAGTHAVGGRTTGGSSQGGGVGQAGFTAAGGAIASDRCSAPPEVGQCQAAIQRWFHDPLTNQCRTFVWGGCGGNTNNYDSLAACEAACGGSEPKACRLPSDCAIVPVGCCAVCDGPNVSIAQFTAYNELYADQYRCSVAQDAAPAPGGAGIGLPAPCTPCAAPVPGQGTLKYFVPDCVQGQCVVQDLRTSPLTACMSDQECRLRNGTSCCEGCGGADQYVAVRSDGSFEKAACGDAPTACPECLPALPVNMVAYCADTGHCGVAYVAPTGP